MRKETVWIAIVVVLSACGGRTSQPPAAAPPSTAPEAAVPAGWKTVRYGDLEVAVPGIWTVEGLQINEACGRALDRSVRRQRYTRVVAASCPSMPSPPTPTSSVTIECLYGAARELTPAISGGTSDTTVVDGTPLHRGQSGAGDYYVTVATAAAVSVVEVDAPGAVGRAIFDSITLSGQHC